MKLTGNGSYALLNQAVTPKGKLIIFILLERESFPLLPFSPKTDLCSPNSIISGSIRASLHVTQLEGDAKVGSLK